MLRPRNLGFGARGQRRSQWLLTAICKVTASASSSSASLSTLPLYSGSGLLSPSQLQRSHPESACVEWQRRTYATSSQSTESPPPKSIAIIGGGLTGLTTALYMSKYVPDAKITIYEKSNRLGGWIDTEKVAVKTPDGKEGVVHFERGARLVKGVPRNSFRNLDALLFYDLLLKLDLPTGSVRSVGPGMYVGRYVYYPDHLVELGIRPLSDFAGNPFGYLGHLVSQIASLFTEPAFKDLFPSLRNWYKTRVPSVKEVDVSVGDYLAGRFGSRSLVDNLMSAMIHGIYGGDVWKLSVDSSPLRWRKRHTDYLQSLMSKARGVTWAPGPDVELLYSFLLDQKPALLAWNEPADEFAWMWFRDGFSTLTNGLAAWLRERPNVTIKLNQSIDSLVYQPDTDTVALTHEKGGHAVLYDKVVSTIFAGDLSPLVKPNLVPTLKEIKAVSIQAVNLWYPTPGLNHPFHGFGYLIPQSLPYDQNPEGALGVMFDSDREAMFRPDLAVSDDAPADFDRFADTVPGSKFTVLLGGHLMEGLELPGGEKAIEMAKSVLERHLGIPKEESTHAVGSTKTCRNCIPQHLVGHRQRMIELDGELQRTFHGRLAVIGGSYQLPGVLPSIRAAWDISREVAQEFGTDKYYRTPQTAEKQKKMVEDIGPVLPTGLGRAAYPGRLLPLGKHFSTWLRSNAEEIRKAFTADYEKMYGRGPKDE
ncbi:hypothetical protein V8F33_003942 [Rhypophila sp. PSN 637]